MQKNTKISNAVINRLPMYHRFLTDLKSNGAHKMSSSSLANIMNLTASQIRQDLNCFGGFGQQGYGYDIGHLLKSICKILCIDQNKNTILIGAGRLGTTLISHISFANLGFNITGIYDNNPDIIGTKINDIEIQNISALEIDTNNENIDIAILCIPKTECHETVNFLIKNGIKSFWNFTNYDLQINFVKDRIIVENIHMSDSLMRLSYKHSSLNNIS